MALQKKLFILFSAIVIFPLVFCSVLLYRQSVDIIEKNTGKIQSARLDYFADRFNLIINKLYQDLLNLAVNSNIRKIVMEGMKAHSLGNLENLSYLNQATRNILFTDNMIQSIIIYSQINNWLFVSGNAASNIYFGDFEDMEWPKKAVNKEHGVFMALSSSVSALVKTDGEKVISLFVSLRNARQEPQGYISINLDIRAVQRQLAEILQGSGYQSSLIIDEHENIVSIYGPPVTLEALSRFLGKMTEKRHAGYFIDSMAGESYMISHTVIPRHNWKIIISTPLKQIIHQNRMITIVVLIILSVFIVLSVALAYVLSVNLLHPLMILFQAMQRIKEGKLAYAIPNTRKDEIGLLYDGFNEMSKNLDTMMDKLYKEESIKKDLRLKMMGYQINAHFLYNTLDVIHWIAQINKVPKIASLVSSLVSYFRIILSEGHDIIPIGQVVQMAENYINIYSIKSDFIVDFIVDIDRSLYEYKTLKYVFQPLLENALNHGIEEKADNGIVRLACEHISRPESSGDLLFTISDTGAGIRPEKLDALNRILENSDQDEIGNFALRNINMQIKIHYGNQYGIKIESTLGEGTSIFVRVPAVSEEHHVQNAGM